MTPQNQQHQQCPERRNDIGGKLSWLLVAAIVGSIGNIAWAQATKGEVKADLAMEKTSKNSTEIEVLKTKFDNISYRLDEIKALIQKGP